MNNWSWENPGGFGDQVDLLNVQTTSWRNVKRTGEQFSWYSRDNPSVKISPPSCRQYTPGDFLAVRPLNPNEKIDQDVDDDTLANPSAPSGGRSRPGDGNDNYNSESEEDTQGGDQGTGIGMGTN